MNDRSKNRAANQSMANAMRWSRAQRATRRTFLEQCSLGLGAIALGQITAKPGASVAAETNATGGAVEAHRAPAGDRPARAKAVIYIDMSGGPPQHELFDWKPTLVKHHLQPCPDSLLAGQKFPFIKGHPLLLGTPYKFAQHGASGCWMSELLPNLAKLADELTVVRSMHTDQFNHAPAELLMFTGSPRNGGAAMGSWVTYGLGSENSDLPGFVVLLSGGTDPSGGKSLWGSGFLPSVFQGVQCRAEGEPILYVNDPPGMTRAQRRASLDALGELNQLELSQFGDPETQTRIAQYELAYRMQMSVPAVMDLAQESRQTLDLYGAEPGGGSLANNCLLARRLIEQGVRFVQLYDWGWDCHGTGPGDDIVKHLPDKCRQLDRPVAALLTDLKARGLLDETLVVWGGEFGRTSMNEARDGSKFLGRDHHPHSFTMWMAGGGMKPGLSFGQTDELGYYVTEGKVEIHDLQATILHLLGIDPFRFSYRVQGLDQRLVGPTEEPRIRQELLA